MRFVDKSRGQPTRWRWDFGDGITSIEQNPVHIYQMPGMYNVSLKIATGQASALKIWRRCVSAFAGKSGQKVAVFSDVPSGYWAFSAITACLEAGVVSGYPDGTFLPNLEVSRDQVAVYMSRALAGGDQAVPAGPVQASFLDVPTDHWAYRYVEYTKKANVILGFADGLYRPASKVDRAQMAVFLARALANPTGEEGLQSYAPPATPTFTNVTGSNEWSWCYQHVEYIVSRHVISGYPDKTYRPDVVCARSQMAVFLARAFELPM